MAYPLFAPATRLAYLNATTQSYYLAHGDNLDGMAYLQYCKPPDCRYNTSGDYAALRWINVHIQGDPVIVESAGGEYSSWGRVSIFTGLPTLMGWVGHEYQWRVNWLTRTDHPDALTQRTHDLDTIYTNADSSVVLATMARYHAQYLYVGALEYMKYYPRADLQRFRLFMHVVYDRNDVTIYQVKN